MHHPATLALRPTHRVRRPLLFLAVSFVILLAALPAQPTPAPVRPTAAAQRAPAQTLDDAIAQAQARLTRNGDDANAYAEFGLLLLQRVRLTADASDYGRAGQAFDAALARDPNQIDALVGKGILALALHDFDGAKVWAGRARAHNPFRPEPLGILTDAHVELGEYDAAIQVAQQRMDMRPDLSAYTRVSYLRELHGDMDGAITAMQRAVKAAGQPGSEPMLWCLVQLGNLYLNRGDLGAAAAAYRQALAQDAAYPYAQAGLARVWAAQDRQDEAITAYRAVLDRLPLPGVAIALGELLEAQGRPAEAGQAYDLVRLIQTLNQGAGMDVDLELALFNTEHGDDPDAALRQAEAAYRARPTVYGADALAWALYHSDRFAAARIASRAALRLGTQDARLYYHAGMIALAAGDPVAARDYLTQAQRINPFFSPLEGPRLTAALAGLGQS